MNIHPMQAIGINSQAVNFTALPPLSLYIHIPWCVKKCPYCDFNSHEARASSLSNGHGKVTIPDNETRHARSLTPVPPLMKLLAIPLSQQAGKCLVIPKGEGYGSSLREFHVNKGEGRGGGESLLPQEQEYVAALTRDLEMALPQIWGRKVYTVFFGGGTPSLLSGEGVAEILRQVRMLLPLAGDVEITLEANPGTVEADKFAAFREAGVNRLSMGIQSFNDTHLKSLGRIHSADEAKSAIAIAQRHFDNINLDLMYALPNQTLDQALQDVQTALSFSPQHLSVYHLTLEPNTLFYRNPPSLPDDDASSDMQQSIENLLAENGYQHYETSAFAQPNRRSKHNLNYWKFGDYLGIGAGAHSKISFPDKIIREARYKQPQAYMQQVALGEPIQTTNEVSRAELPFEFMMNALRLNDGFDSVLFNERTSLSLIAIQRELAEAERRGLLRRDLTRIAPTKLGQRFLNDLLEIFLKDKS